MQNKKINFVFWGTPDVASETLEILKENDYLPALIITSPDAKKGRGMQIQQSPVAIFAEQNNIPCLKPKELDKEFIYNLEPITYNLFLVVAYGKIIPENILDIPKLGSINIHYSLLPKYRGASPVESAILNGETETGVTIQKMKFKMDSGPIIAQEKVNIFPDEKSPDLRTRLKKIGGELLVKILPDFMNGKIKEIPQDKNQATFCRKIKKEDGLIDLKNDAIKNYNKFRAYATWPRIFFLARRSLGEGGFKNRRIIITDAMLENNQFIIKKVLPEGKKEISWETFQKHISQ